MMTRLAMLAALALLTAAFDAHAVPCTAPAELAAVRAAAAAACPCEVTRAEYRRCNREFMLATRETTPLPNACWQEFRRGVSRSICGKPGRVACCMPSPSGGQRCGIVTAAKCDQRGGCASARVSCADACTDSGCASPPAVCGNGVIEGTEGCDGGPFCTAQCQPPYPWCCQYPAPSCSLADDEFVSDELVLGSCVGSGGTYHPGAQPAHDPSCQELVPGTLNNGACTPLTLPAPLTLCCENATPACQQTTTADEGTLVAFMHDCGYGGYPRVVEGTCGGAGTCVPAH